ncbi:acyltransferase [soil metagenome]
MHEKVKPDFTILDGLRGIAATYVLINHSRGNLCEGAREYAARIPMELWSLKTKMYFALLQTTILGREFVIFFFVLSGFSIAYSLQHRHDPLKFYKRRLVRLYPPYLLALITAALCYWAISIVYSPLLHNLTSVFANAHHIFFNLIYLPKGDLIPQFWSLTHEVLFYLIIPFAILKRRYYYIISVLLYLYGWYFETQVSRFEYPLQNFLLEFNIFFVIGICFFHNYYRVANALKLTTIKIILFSLILFFSMIVVRYYTSEDNKITPLLSALLSIILVVAFLQKRITNKILVYLGSMSYSIYIFHFAFLVLIRALLLRSGVIGSGTYIPEWIWIAAVFVCIFICHLLYLVSEKPTKRYLNKLRKT